MPSPASQQPPGAASTPVTRTPSRCGTGPVTATVPLTSYPTSPLSATTAGAAGGATTTTSSPPPSSDAHPLQVEAPPSRAGQLLWELHPAAWSRLAGLLMRRWVIGEALA